jgi:hypothetical protein
LNDRHKDRESRYRIFILYRFQLWKHLDALNKDDDDEAYSELRKESDRRRKTNGSAGISLHPDRVEACRFNFHQVIELILVLGRDPSAIDRLWEQLEEEHKSACTHHAQCIGTSIRLQNCTLQEEFKTLIPSVTSLNPLTWYFLCRQIGPTVRQRLAKYQGESEFLHFLRNGETESEYLAYSLGLERVPQNWLVENDDFIWTLPKTFPNERAKQEAWADFLFLELHTETPQATRSGIERTLAIEPDPSSYIQEG